MSRAAEFEWLRPAAEIDPDLTLEYGLKRPLIAASVVLKAESAGKGAVNLTGDLSAKLALTKKYAFRVASQPQPGPVAAFSEYREIDSSTGEALQVWRVSGAEMRLERRGKPEKRIDASAIQGSEVRMFDPLSLFGALLASDLRPSVLYGAIVVAGSKIHLLMVEGSKGAGGALSFKGRTDRLTEIVAEPQLVKLAQSIPSSKNAFSFEWDEPRRLPAAFGFTVPVAGALEVRLLR